MVKASVIGATGYAGQELVRILAGHPMVTLTGLGVQNYEGKRFSEVYPHFRGIVDQVCVHVRDPALLEEPDVVFLAMPHGYSASLAKEALARRKKVVDLGADFRLRDGEQYTRWYQKPAPEADLLARAVYGIPELHRDAIARTALLANPGCYPTTVILGLAPLLETGRADPDSIIADSKSGVSGAGRGASLGTHFSEITENFSVYGLPAHRHTPEMEQELSRICGRNLTISFIPHLVPMVRGMLSTIYVRLTGKWTQESLHALYAGRYAGEPFVRVRPSGEYPRTKEVRGSNMCDLGVYYNEDKNMAVIVSVIDNLGKGASGQAVQNMNLMFGLEETAGLTHIAIYP
jgi:N-acetyl-gamma-glutamyl-phosphate reductase